MDQCIWNICNSNCIMCTNPFGFRNEKDAAEHYNKEKILELIESNSENIRKNGISLTGGEPTIHPHFLDILKKIRADIPKAEISFATNGRRFIYPDFTKNVLSINDLQIRTVIHSYKAETHNSITRTPNSFKQTIKGIKNIFKQRNDSHVISLRLVLLKQNYKELDKISEFIYSEFGNFFRRQDKIAYIFPEYEGRAKKNIKQVGITYSQAQPYMEEVLQKWPDKFYEKFFAFHFPLCVIDSSLWQHIVRSIPVSNDEYIFLEKCDDCIYKKYCVSIHNDYIKEFGGDEFTPFTEEVDNELTIDKNNFFRPIKNS